MWLINRIREKMIRKWVVLNIGITMFVIGLVGFTIKELACYQFNQYANSALQSEQFRQVLGHYLFNAGLLALAIAILVHLFFAKKILAPLHALSHVSGNDDRNLNLLQNAFAKDEVGKIASDLHKVSNELTCLYRQKNQMMADLAHELRTPLTNLNGYLEGLESGVFDQDETVYSVLKEECLHLTKLTENMHELHQWENRQIKINNEWTAIGDEIQSEVALFQDQFNESGIRVNLQIEPVHIYCDRNAISAILPRLFDNIVRYDVGKWVTVEGKWLDDNYVISVSNRGVVIPESAEKHLFERFYRVEHSRNRETGGSGLGLAIVKEIVASFHGQTGLHRINDVHTFWFSIPVSDRVKCCGSENE